MMERSLQCSPYNWEQDNETKIFKVLKINYQCRILHSVKISFNSKDKWKTFSPKLEGFVSTNWTTSKGKGSSSRWGETTLGGMQDFSENNEENQKRLILKRKGNYFIRFTYTKYSSFKHRVHNFSILNIFFLLTLGKFSFLSQKN